MKTLRQTDPIKICAEKLRKECKVFDFLLDNSYCDAEDLECSLKNYKEHRPSLGSSSSIPYLSMEKNQFIFNVNVISFE